MNGRAGGGGRGGSGGMMRALALHTRSGPFKHTRAGGGGGEMMRMLTLSLCLWWEGGRRLCGDVGVWVCGFYVGASCRQANTCSGRYGIRRRACCGDSD